MNKSHRHLSRRSPPVRTSVAEQAPDSARTERGGWTQDSFFRHIVSGMRNAVLAITRDGGLALMNDEAYRVFGLAKQPDDLGRPAALVLKGHPEVARVLAGVFDLHSLPNRVEMRLKPENTVIGYTVALVRDDEGGVIGAAMFFKDLTRVEQLQERERLRDRLAAVGEMAAVIAHEVKNPLAGIEVMAGLLRRNIPQAPDAQAMLTDIINEAKMANAIVQEVLDFVRPIRLDVGRTAVTDAVLGAIHLADTKATRGGIAVDVRLAAGLPDIQADRYQLMQVFTNLLMNAYEAMDGKGHIVITGVLMRLEDGERRDVVLMEVSDDGPGIPQHLSDKVFQPFFSTKPQGSGLGLAIVRKIVDAHQGSIDMRTIPGQGTTIRLTLPVTADDR
jgi:signal transduction histidine kinase